MDSKKKEKMILRRKFTGRNHPKIPYGAEIIMVKTARSRVLVEYKGEKFWIPSGRARCFSKGNSNISKMDLYCIAHIPL
jgi:hypothetical protein